MKDGDIVQMGFTKFRYEVVTPTYSRLVPLPGNEDWFINYPLHNPDWHLKEKK